MRVWLLTMAIFSVFDGYFFGYFRVEASIITWQYAVYRRLFSDPKIHDLDWLFGVKFCFRGGLSG